jgi:hypothetical protein
MLMRECASSLACVHQVFQKYFTETDVDLLFARLKEPNSKHMTFASFVTALETVSATLFTEVKRYHYRRGKEARMLTLLCECLLEGPWARGIKQQLEDRVRAFVDALWTRVQALVRGWVERRRFVRRKARWAQERWAQRLAAAAVRIQALFRRTHARMQAVRLAQDTYIKYIDPTSKLPYWYHPRTKRSLWAKPRIFGKFDVRRAKALPDKTTEFVVMCVNCDVALAAMACEECDEAFCAECFEGVHVKGHKREHKPTPIRMCPECKYQMSTKACRQCTFKAGQTVHYCDVCFYNVHGDAPDMQKHAFDEIVMNCVECERYAARWRCLDCHDLYCTPCFSKVGFLIMSCTTRCFPV